MRRIAGFSIAALIIGVCLLALPGSSPFGGSSGTGLATAAAPAQRIGMKVLLISDNSDGGYAAGDWVNTLNREGMPYTEVTTNPSSLGSVALPPLSSTASDGTQVANYEGVVVAVSGNSGLSPAQWATLQTFEQQFSVRQVTAYVSPSSDYGLTYAGRTFGASGQTDPVPSPTLTADGRATFPYLNTISLDPTTFGYEGNATPASGTSVDTLITDAAGSSLVGIYTAADGRQTMYQTFAENQYEIQSELLRHGELDWLARNTYFGDQRNYLTTNIDDNFLADDVWSVNGVAGEVSPHSTDFLPADAVREVPSDVTTAASWSKAHNFRMDMLFNGGGSVQFADGCTEASAGDGGDGGTATDCTGAATGTDPLLTEFQANDPTTGKPYTGDFSWINHTWDHPNLDEGCATTNYIEAEINQNTAWGSKAASAGNPTSGGLGLAASTDPAAALGAENPNVVVTGEHSGLANLIPGNPGQVDPPSLDSATASATGGLLPAGSYIYAISDQFNTAAPGVAPVAGTGESAASISAPVTTTGTTSAVTLSWGAVCKAADYFVYRAPYTPPVAPATTGTIGAWQRIGSRPANTTADFTNPASTSNTTGGGAAALTFADTNTPAAGFPVSASPLTDGTAVESAYEQNPNLDAAFSGTSNGGIKYFGADASKPYPNPADASFATGAPPAGAFPNGSTFIDANGVGIPRYPTNIYYNVSTNAEEVDEYQTLYDLPTCTPVSGITTCNPAGTAFTIGDIIASVDQGMFQHVMGNDPRPHYFHQSNLMSSTTSGATGNGDGLYYETMNPLLSQYNQYFAANAPLVQPTMAQTGALLSEQSAWAAADQSAVTGSIQGSTVTVDNTTGSAIELPLTGTTGGTAYAGTQSYWTSAANGTSTYTALAAWPAPPTTPVVVTVPTGPAPGGPAPKGTAVKPPAQPGSGSVGPKTITKPGQPKAKPTPTIFYRAVQVNPKTVSVRRGRAVVSLQCRASRGKTARNRLCAGTVAVRVSGRTVKVRFRFRSPKTALVSVALPRRARTALAAHPRGHAGRKLNAKLVITTSQSHARGRVTRGSLTIRG